MTLEKDFLKIRPVRLFLFITDSRPILLPGLEGETLAAPRRLGHVYQVIKSDISHPPIQRMGNHAGQRHFQMPRLFRDPRTPLSPEVRLHGVQRRCLGKRPLSWLWISASRPHSPERRRPYYFGGAVPSALNEPDELCYAGEPPPDAQRQVRCFYSPPRPTPGSCRRLGTPRDKKERKGLRLGPLRPAQRAHQGDLATGSTSTWDRWSDQPEIKDDTERPFPITGSSKDRCRRHGRSLSRRGYRSSTAR